MISRMTTFIQKPMQYLQFLIRRLVIFFAPFLLWLFLSGQFRQTPSKKTSLRGAGLDIFKFKQQTAVETPSWFYWVLGIGIVLAIATVYYMMYKKKREAKQQINKISHEKAQLRLDVLLSKLNIIEPERKLLENIADGATAPDDMLPLVESVEDFEHKVKEFKKVKREPKILKSIYHIRHKLGFDFHNKRANFISTQMLAGGLKLECEIPHPKKNILFVSPILTVSETGILLKPPTVKKKPVNLKRFPHLICRIRREEEADYEFKLPIVNQIFGKPDAVVLGHTDKIKKLFIREAQRVSIDVFTTFYVMSEEQLNASGVPKSAKTDMVLESVNGRIVDISVGGVKAALDELPNKLSTGDFLIFHLQGANLRDDLRGKVLKVIPEENHHNVHLQFYRSRELERMKIKKFVYRMEKENPSGGSKKAAPPSPSPKPKDAEAVSSKERNALLN